MQVRVLSPAPALRRLGRRLAVALALLAGAAACGADPHSDPQSDPYWTAVRPPAEGPYWEWAPETWESEDGLVRKLVMFTETYDILDIYPSMRGPQSFMQVRFGRADEEPELLWVKGVRADIVDEHGEPASREFMCHMVAGIASFKSRNESLGIVSSDARIATLSQGVYHKEYPPGFGVPVLSTDLLLLNSQVLNLNRPDEYHRVRHKVVALVIRDSERRRPIQALANTYAQAMVRLEGDAAQGYPGVRMADQERHGLACALGANADPKLRAWHDDYGRTFSHHWIVPPGHQTYHTTVTQMLDLRSDTTVHAIDVHLHPFAESLELRDVTTDETVFKSHATQVERGIGLDRVELFSSEEGLPVYADHQYALIATYDNPTDKPADAMALMYLAVRDDGFDPSLALGPRASERRALHRRLRTEQALEHWQKAVAADPADPVAQYKVGLAYHQLGRTEESRAAFARVLELDPDHAEARAALDALGSGVPPAP